MEYEGNSGEIKMEYKEDSGWVVNDVVLGSSFGGIPMTRF